MYFSICSWLKGNLLDPSKQSFKAKVLFAPCNYKCFFMLPCWEKDCFLVFLAKELYLNRLHQMFLHFSSTLCEVDGQNKGMLYKCIKLYCFNFHTTFKSNIYPSIVFYMSYLLSGSVLSFAVPHPHAELRTLKPAVLALKEIQIK